MALFSRQRSATPSRRIVIGRSPAGLPRTYRLVRPRGWTAQLAAGLWSLLP
jgi:hypothetical protein